MAKNIGGRFFMLLIIAICLTFATTAGAETQNIILESSVQNKRSPVESMPTFTAEIALPSLEQTEIIFGLINGKCETFTDTIQVTSGTQELIYSPLGYVVYERENVAGMRELINFGLYNAIEFDGSWLCDSSREAAFMSREAAQELIEDYLNQYGMTGWDNNIALYYIGMDDWRSALDLYGDEVSKYTDIKSCKDIYYAVVTFGHDSIDFDDREYMLLNDRCIFASAVYMIIDENGILDAEFWDCYRANEASPYKTLLGYDEVIDILDSYYDGIYTNRKVSVCEAKLVYTAYPLSPTEYEIVPTWRFGIRGFAENADYIREYVRINAANGRILE